MNGIEDEYFKNERRQGMLLNILFLWASLHPKTSYRQGMHEIVAPILYVLEQEREQWNIEIDDSELENVSHSFNSETEKQEFITIINELSDEMYQNDSQLESSVYWLFDLIMNELEPLYSPVTGADEQPAIVHYCTKIQEHMLRGLDPQLCTHLEENFVQAQLYGMKWSRLLLGREFELNDKSLLRIWDYMFACVLDARMIKMSSINKNHVPHAHTSLKKHHSSQKDLKINNNSNNNQNSSNSTPSLSSSPSSSSSNITSKITQNVNPVPLDPLSGALYPKPEVNDEDEDNSGDEKEETHLIKRNESDSDDTDDDILWTTSSAVVKTSSRFGPSSPLLDALADFMLAMLLHVKYSLNFVFLLFYFILFDLIRFVIN